MRLKCVVLNGRRIGIIAGLVVLILIVVSAFIAIINNKKTQETFLGSDLGMEIIESEFPAENTKKEDKHLKIIKENPMFSELGEDVNEREAEESETEKPEALPSTSPEPSPEEIYEDNLYGEMKMRNETDYNVNLNELALQELPFEVDGDEVEVLIMHTHTTESYSSSETTVYSAYENGRTTDDLKNMTAIGGAAAHILNENGIKTIHDTTVHDYPTYNNAYTRSAATINKNLKDNKDIKIVLDFHRDAFPGSGEGKRKLTTEINGEKAAQIMIVAGTDGNGLRHDKWRGNLVFAAQLQKRANEMYPGLMRNLNLRKERFNQHLTPGSLIIEVGSNTNTFEEAKKAAEAFAEVIVSVLNYN